MEFHMGNIVKAVLKEKHMKQRVFVGVLGDESRISKLMRTADWRLSDVIDASTAMHCNLFTYLVNTNGPDILQEDSPVYVTMQAKKELEETTERLQEKADMLQLCRESVALLKEKVRKLEIELNSRNSG